MSKKPIKKRSFFESNRGAHRHRADIHLDFNIQLRVDNNPFFLERFKSRYFNFQIYRRGASCGESKHPVTTGMSHGDDPILVS